MTRSAAAESVVTAVPVRIRRIDPSLPLPQYESAGAVGFDLLARVAVDVAPGEIVRIPANVVIEVPPGYGLVIASRSSTPKRHGLAIPHGIGLIDQDYCGPDDEIHLQVQNFRAESIRVERGTRLSQGLLVPVVRAIWQEVTSSTRATRGGFGSTGSQSTQSSYAALGEAQRDGQE